MTRRLIFTTLAVLALAAFPGRASADNALDYLPDGFSTVTQASGLTDPTAVAYLPDGRMLVAEKAGTVRIVSKSGHLRSTPLVDISGHVATYEDRGLLGIAVDSSFADNGFVYLLYTYDDASKQPQAPKTSRLTRIHVLQDGTVESPSSPETVLAGSVGHAPCPTPGDTVDCIPSDGASHSIGTVRSAPDGTLWFGSGDAAGYNTADPTAFRTYDERTMSGKIMHVDRDGQGLADHPFCPGETDLGKVCTKLYAKGFRNPFRFYVRPEGGLVAGDVGWNSREEIDLVVGGQSYGWPCYEGSMQTPSYRDLSACEPQYALTHAPPAYEYPHLDGGAAVQAGPRYSASQYPEAYRGSWFFGDYAMGFVKLLDIDDHNRIVNVRDFASGYHGVDLELAPNGDLVYVDLAGGKVERVVYGNRAPVAVATATPASGDPPLATTLSGSASSDPDGDELVSYEWDFDDDGTVDDTGPSVSHVYPAGAYTATLTVTDAHGLSASDSVLITAGESPPTATIESPADGALFRPGVPVALRGSGTDAQDGELSGAALHWRVVIHHGAHTHVAIDDATGRELTFTPPGDHDADSYYEIRLIARDSAGLEDAKTVTIRPRTVQLALASEPAGVVLSYSGASHTAPALLTAAVGYRTSISAPAAFTLGATTYVFDRWSDGGARAHDIVVPDVNSKLTAVYRGAAFDELPPVGGGAPAIAPAAPGAVRRPRLVWNAAHRAGLRSLSGRLLGVASRPRIKVALRTRATRCRRWSQAAGRLAHARARCGRSPAWIHASLVRAGATSWRWRARLRGAVPPGRYVVSARALDVRGRLLSAVSSAFRLSP